MEGYQLGGERVRMGGKVQRLRSIIGRYQIGDVKKSIGNGEAKELTCMTHGHELRGRGLAIAGEKGGYWAEGAKGKNWDSYNSIINKMYFLKSRIFILLLERRVRVLIEGMNLYLETHLHRELPGNISSWLQWNQMESYSKYLQH